MTAEEVPFGSLVRKAVAGVRLNPPSDRAAFSMDGPECEVVGHPVLLALSRKDFVGETLGLPVDERLEGTLAATAVAAWLGARVFRTHDVLATRRTLDMVAAVRGDAPPARAVRGLA